jgi:hypothetical protein
MSVEIKVYIPCKNEGCYEDTGSYKVYDSNGTFAYLVDDAYETHLGNDKVIYVCSVACQQVAIQRDKEMAR